MTNSYATDGRCHNAQPGTYGHECGKPATWIGWKPSKYEEGGMFGSGFCDECKQRGWEAVGIHEWKKLTKTEEQ